MSRCQSHGELVGGFVLDALEPAEMEEMRNHVASCPACGREARAMAGLPVLLDQIDPSDIPPPALSPDVEEAVLDRFARERPKPAAAPRRRRRLAAMAGALALVAVAVVAIFTALASDDEPGDSAYATATARAPGAGHRGSRDRLRRRGARRNPGQALGARSRRVEDSGLRALVRAKRWRLGQRRHLPRGRRRRRPGRAHRRRQARRLPLMVVTRRSGAAPERARGTPVLRGDLRY